MSRTGVAVTPIDDGYCNLHWDSFAAAKKTDAIQPLQPAENSNAFAITQGSQVADVMVAYPGRKVQYFRPDYVYLGCYLQLRTGASPSVKCTIRVTPSTIDANGQTLFEPASLDCQFDPGAAASVTPTAVQKCVLPDTWDKVQYLKFEKVVSPDATAIFDALGKVVAGLTIDLVSGAGAVSMALDNLAMKQTLS